MREVTRCDQEEISSSRRDFEKIKTGAADSKVPLGTHTGSAGCYKAQVGAGLFRRLSPDPELLGLSIQ